MTEAKLCIFCGAQVEETVATRHDLLTMEKCPRCGSIGFKAKAKDLGPSRTKGTLGQRLGKAFSKAVRLIKAKG